MAANGRWLTVFVAIFVHLQLVCAQTDSSPNTPVAPDTTPTVTSTESPTTPSGTQSVPANTNLAECTCDLLVGGCDVNCCCDPDCTANDRLAFSQCDDEYLAANSQTCVQSSVIFRTNTPYTLNTTVPGLFCIQTDNYNQRNYFNVPEIINSSAQFDEYKQQYGGYSFQPTNTTESLRNSFYKSGETIYTVYESGAVGVLGLPAPMSSTYCADTNPAAYLIGQSLECVRPINNLPVDCQQSPSLNAQTYYQGFRVVTTPEVFSLIIDNGTVPDVTTLSPGNDTSPITDTVYDLYNSSYAIDINPIPVFTCIGIDGLNKTCDFTEVPSPTYESDPTTDSFYCMNTLVQTTYMIETNGTNGIVAVNVSFVFQDIDESNIPVNQIFKTEFTVLDQTVEFVRSGNPGYLVGQPLLAGLLLTQPQLDGTNLYAIQIDQDRTNWLTMVTSGVDGQCISDPNDRVSVTYGENLRSGCFVSVFYENMTSLCNLINQASWNALRGNNPPQYIGSFGNSNSSSVGDWVEIFGYNTNPETSSPDTSQPGVCRNVLTGMTIQVVYANVGALGEPQPQVIGAEFQYTYQTEVRFQCFGAYCQPGNGNLQQKLEIVSAVNFIDASSPAQGVSAQRPKVTASLPANFFYPFS